MTPKFRGMLEELKKLQSNCDQDADDLMKTIASTDQRRVKVFSESKDKIKKHVSQTLDGINEFFDSMEKTNGGPTLDDSSESSENSPAANKPHESL